MQTYVNSYNFCLSLSPSLSLNISTYTQLTEELTSSSQLHLFLNHGDRCGTTDDFTTSSLQFSLFSTGHWDLANSSCVHSLMLSSHLFSVYLVFFHLSLCLARWFWPDKMNRRYVHATSVCISLQWSGLHGVQLPAGSWQTSLLVTWSFYEMCSIFGQRMSYPPCADPFSYEDFYRWPFQCFQVKYQILYLVRILKYVDLLQLLAFNPPARVHRRQWNRRLVIYFGQIRLDSDTIVHKFESSENVKTNFPWLWVHFFQAQQKT